MGDPNPVFCTLNKIRCGLEANEISVGAAITLFCFAKYLEV
jgi:hypothetical protein